MKLDLSGATALVTGASSGIGQATAESLAALGAKVAVTGRRRQRLEALVETITGNGGQAVAVPGDVTEQPEAAAMVDRAVDQLGRLDIVVNNAGLMLLGPMETAPVEEFDRMIGVNLQGLAYIAHAAVPHLVAAAAENERGVSDLVNISSTSGRQPLINSAVYSMTKWGVTGFSYALREELARRNVRVSVIEPGGVDTELHTHVRPEVLATPNPDFLGFDLLESEDVADSVVFVVTRPQRCAVNEIMVRPTWQIV